MHDFYAGYYAKANGKPLPENASDAFRHGYTKREEDEIDEFARKMGYID